MKENSVSVFEKNVLRGTFELKTKSESCGENRITKTFINILGKIK